MIIHAISDTHGKHKHFTLPGGDLLLFAGDCTASGSVQQASLFVEWLQQQPYTHKVMVAGNHDWCFEQDPKGMRRECENFGIHLLNDSGVTIEGIKIWGSPISPWFYDWAFNRHRGPEIQKHWDLIPMNTEILITHGPCNGVLDRTRSRQYAGCKDLNLAMRKTSIKLHVCGHIHEAKGYTVVQERLYVNASALDANYLPTRNVPIQINLTNGKYSISKTSRNLRHDERP
jgi:Icc-related predicted phosphoesterase